MSAMRTVNAQEIRRRSTGTLVPIYGALTQVMKAHKANETRLNPPPADSRCCYPPRLATRL